MATITKNLDEYEVDMKFGDDIRNSLGNVSVNNLRKPFLEFPTIFKSVESYFDANMMNIIDEWGLLLENDLDAFDTNLSKVEKNISDLEGFRDTSEKETDNLEKEINALKKSK